MDEQTPQQPQSQPLTQPQPQPQPQPSAPKSSNPKIKVAAIIVILLIAAGLVYYFVLSKKFQKVAPNSKESQQTAQQNGSSSSAMPHGPEISNLVMTKIDPQKGSYLVDKKGMTLYSFDKDLPGKSNCNDTCLANWPIFESPNPPPPNLEGEIGIIKLPNGKYMYTYLNKPLYYYIQDKQPGDTKGDGVGNVWHLVKP